MLQQPGHCEWEIYGENVASTARYALCASISLPRKFDQADIDGVVQSTAPAEAVTGWTRATGDGRKAEEDRGA